MRKIALTITLLLSFCALLASGSFVAAGGGSPDGHIEPLDIGRQSFCNFPDGPPSTGVAHLPYAAAQTFRQSSLAAAAPAPLSSSVFEKFVRCPAGDPTNPDCTDLLKWKTANDGVGYYRDVIFSAVTLISNAMDGEQWGMTIRNPMGQEFSFTPVTFTSNGDCFNFPSHQICGAKSIRIYWYFKIQCAPDGQWSAIPSYGGSALAEVPFYISPQLGSPEEVAARMPPISQQSYPNDPYGGVCHRAGQQDIFPCSENQQGQVPWTIAELGCSLVTLTNILNYHGVQTNPLALNQWLLENNFYDRNGNIIDLGKSITQYADTQDKTLTFVGHFKASPNFIQEYVCLYGPALLRVIGNTHTVTLTGTDGVSASNWTFLDAYDGIYKDLSSSGYGAQADDVAVFAGPEQEFTDDRSGVSFTFHSPVEAFIVDPLGRRQGLDPRTGVRYNEIPNGFYGEHSTIGPVLPDGYEPAKLLELQRPAEGTYTLTVVGTGAGTYDAEFKMYDRNFNRSQLNFVDVATAPGVVHTYKIEFSKAPGSQIVTAGSFDGGGQRPRDVNKFLTYAQPLATSTALPAGTTSYPLLVFFSQTVIPSTFRAQLNGVDVTSLFVPSQGGAQVVSLPLQSGRNVLQLSVNGNLPNRVATDTDRLIFDVP